nr:PAS domain-containing protein [Micromonospora sp. DSM 115978]
TPAALAEVPDDGSAVPLADDATTAADTAAFAARDPSLRDGGYILLELPTSVAFSGLRPSQLGRDLLLFAAVAVTLFGVALSAHLWERTVRRDDEQLAELLHNVHDIVIVVDRHGHATFVSSAITRLLGYAVDLPRTSVHPDDRMRLSRVLGADAT